MPGGNKPPKTSSGQRRKCDSCGGTGKVNKKVCGACRGSGYVTIGTV